MADAVIAPPSVGRPRVQRLFWDLSLTGITQVAMLLGNVLVISLVGRFMGALALAEYLVLRRVVAWMQTAFPLGLGVAQARYVAHAHGRKDGQQGSYFAATLLILATVAVTLGITLNLGRDTFARWLFGTDQQMPHLIFPLTVLIAGIAVHIAVYGYYRGCLQMQMANTLQTINYGVLPIAAILALARTRSVAVIVTVTGAGMAIFAFGFSLPILREVFSRARQWPFRQGAELLRYGLARVPGDFGGGALFALGPMIALHYLPLTQVSYLLLGLSLLTGVSVSVAPLGLVLLSKVSMMLASNRLEEVQTSLRYLLTSILETSVFVGIQIVIFADVLLRVWLGPGYVDRITVTRIVVLAIPFHLYYAALRSFIDAACVKAYNAMNILVSLMVFLVLSGATVLFVPRNLLLEGLATALLIAIAVLGWTTARAVKTIFHTSIDWRRSLPPLMVALALGAVSLLFRWKTGFRLDVLESAIVGSLMGLVFVAFLAVQRSSWMVYFLQIAFPKWRIPARSATGLGKLSLS